MTLAEYLRAAAARAFLEAVHDCATFPAGWVVEGWGLPDPNARFAGTYTSKVEADAIIERAGGLERIWTAELARVGAVETNSPKEGDVGIIWVLGASGPEKIGAIFTGKRWACLAPKGVFVTHAEFVKAWTRG